MYKKNYLEVIFYVSITFILFSCDTSNKEGVHVNYKKNIIGTWQEINSKTPSFRMDDSVATLLDSVFLFGTQVKYEIVGDTLSFLLEDGRRFAKSKITLLTKDSLRTADETGSKTFIRIK